MPATAAILPGQITIGDLAFAVRESEHCRTVGITVDRDGSLLLHAPTGCDPDAIAAWGWSKRRWVFRKLAEKHLLLAANPAKEFVAGEGFENVANWLMMVTLPAWIWSANCGASTLLVIVRCAAANLPITRAARSLAASTSPTAASTCSRMPHFALSSMQGTPSTVKP